MIVVALSGGCRFSLANSPFKFGGTSNVTVPSISIPLCTDCSTVSGVLIAISVPTTLATMDVECLYKRSLMQRDDPTKPMPLVTPNPNYGVDFQTKFINRLQKAIDFHSDGNIPISPRPIQLTSWKFQNIPIGATGFYYSFGTEPKTWKMQGLSGCKLLSGFCH